MRVSRKQVDEILIAPLATFRRADSVESDLCRTKFGDPAESRRGSSSGHSSRGVGEEEAMNGEGICDFRFFLNLCLGGGEKVGKAWNACTSTSATMAGSTTWTTLSGAPLVSPFSFKRPYRILGSRLHREAPSRYEDGVYMINSNLPSARVISDLLFRGPSGIPNQRNITTMLAFFSQVVAYEILQSTQISCPLEMHKIPVPRCDPIFDAECAGRTEMPFIRAKYDKHTGHGFNSPREQVNDRTSWIDASFLYSTQEPWVAALRSWKNGSLEEGPMEGYPPFNGPHIPLINPAPPQIHRLMNPERLFILGDPRVNENPGLLSFGLILYRWHNVQARRLQKEHPDWTDEELFQAARRWVIATLQKIVLYDFVPAIMAVEDAIPPYKGYSPHVPPGISHSFATAAFRFPHSIVPPGMLLRKRTEHCEFRAEVGGFPALRLCQNWWNAQDIVQEYSVDEIVLGMASQIAEAEDNVVVEDLRDFIFGPMHFTRLDVVSSSIMRGRDNGLPSYNELRKSFGLPPRNWTEINPRFYAENPAMFNELAALYKGNVDDLDAYVGGMLETNGEGPGELFSEIIKDQFVRLRDSDRFWFENKHNNIFSDEEIAQIHSITLHDIIRETTRIQEEQLQRNVFFWRDGDPCGQPFQVNTSGLEECVPFMRFDHFTGNEVTYIYTCIGLATIPLICIGIGYLLIQRRKKMGLVVEPKVHRAFKKAHKTAIYSVQDFGANKEPFSIPAIEWHSEVFCRSVNVVIDSTRCLRVEKPRGGLLRRLDLSNPRLVEVATTEPGSITRYGPYVRLGVHRNYHLVLRFANASDCHKFLDALKMTLGSLDLELLPNDLLLEGAETKDKRKAKLDHFFREAYSRAFQEPRLRDASAATGLVDDAVSVEVLATRLSKAELADALGMREADLFVERMFAVTAKHDDSVSFEEFLAVLQKFTRGSMKEKLELVFDMCDRDGNGRVDRAEFCDFVKSLNVAAGVRLGQEVQDELLDAVLSRSGVSPDRSYLTAKDFEALFGQVEDTHRPVGVHMRGAKLKVNLEETESLRSFTTAAEEVSCLNSNWLAVYLSYLETYRQHIAILFIFVAVNAGVFLERFWHYRYENEHRDLRRVMGVGIAITRGAAGAISFNMGLILLTVCRNVITKARETVLAEYIPFDAAIVFHKIVAVFALIWSAIHAVGHCINFYHVATQSQEGLQCLFQEAVFGSNFLPSISYWFYGTITGITGILLVVVMSIIYVFATPAVMRRAYHAFRLTHLLNILFYALTILHGLPKLLDSPKFWYYVTGPIIVFVVDRIIGMRQEYKQLQILSAALLPSDIIYIKYKRPHSFQFRSGQWIRISCPAFSCSFNERHAFSIASAPQAPTLELYIKAVGPWTWNLRNEISIAQATGGPYPVVHMTGPYGDGNQTWQNFEVAVMIGGGIGVTPFASTLADLAVETSSGKHTGIRCKKVYFLWICPSHKNYEWFVDELRGVEALTEGILEIHIFVTQFFHKFDLRTTMLYICEKHFRGKHAGVSMFTGLRATNHFGRPNFDKFFQFLQKRHYLTPEIGVFSCGPASINEQIRRSCTDANRRRDAPFFTHRFETF
uniref:NAD(P)H oxidase (H2O2-forming) n=1 Tax=Steinernema glaseri TaxID=37863 RepID=A0A1I8ARM6_9BILA